MRDPKNTGGGRVSALAVTSFRVRLGAPRTAGAETSGRTTLAREMWHWYWIGVAAGLGVGLGVLLAGVLAPTPLGWVGAAVVAAAIGAGVALAAQDWQAAVAAGIGGAAGAGGAGQIVRGALERGGTRSGTAVLMVGVGLVLGGLALIPVAGFLEVLAVPVIGARARRRGAGSRYAGLRILARD